ncbi:MAG: DNA repair protein RecN [Butyrivibrio sp.]|jgi:DNA repair protein RecN (Recombination protein N)|nr:DNA repair protein RecN [Butyrivibrio sp.]
MLYSLHVKNLALIDEQEIEFTNGLNILTGETGAGKSVIIGSINLALGGKAEKDMIRTGAEYALIELTFGVDNENQRKAIEAMDIPVEEDGSVVIQRKIMQSRSVSKVCGESVSVKQLRDLSNILINIHGQNDHQELLHKQKHKEILDDYAGDELLKVKDQIRAEYHKYNELKEEYSNTDLDDKTRIRQQELAEFELNEINDAALKLGEDEQLEKDYKRMVNGRRISEALGICGNITGADSDEESVSDNLGRAVRELNSVRSFDEEVNNLADQLMEIESLVGDFNHALSGYLSDLEFDEEDFRATEDRLNLINHLKDKYGDSIEKIIAYGEEKQKELDVLTDLEAHRNQLLKQIQDSESKVLALSEKASKIRKKAAKVLSEKLKSALIDLNFIDVQFEIQVTPDEEKISSTGYDEVAFMISTNPGESMRPLDQIASGGELSRIMLGLKTVLAQKDDIATLVFDEIDAGISGRTAWKVSEKLGVLSKKHQILCITHLPQIAAMNTTHFVIQKNVSNNRTVTTITRMNEDESIGELARLLGMDNVTDAVLDNAKEMRKTALETRNGD